MIVYLATYPRSGNSLLQHWVRSGLRHLTSQVRSKIKSPEHEYEKVRRNSPKFEVRRASQPVPGWEETVVWNEYLAVYSYKEGPWRRSLIPLPLAALTEDLRQSLAREKNVFFLKTHDMPFERYFDGEYVVHSVRHPGAVLWSYFRLQNDLALPKRQLFEGSPPTLESIIRGNSTFGSWVDYQRAWDRTRAQIGNRFLHMLFEDLVSNQHVTFERVAALLNMRLKRVIPVSFEKFSSNFGGKDLRGVSEGYERYYSRRQLELMWEIHGPVAAEYGYRAPDLDRACPDEQIRRLEGMIAAAWRKHAQVTKAYGDALREARQRAHEEATSAAALRKRRFVLRIRG